MTIGGRVPRWLVLVGLGLLGLGLIASPHFFHGEFWEFSKDAGIAFVIASILGLTIDRWFKTDLAQDVFTAVLGHMFPEPFREEIRRISAHKLLCERQSLKLDLKPIGNDRFRLTTTIERTIKNISRSKHPVRAHFHVDDWGHVEDSTKILECKIELPDGTFLDSTIIPNRSRILAQSAPYQLGPGDSAKIYSMSSEIKRQNDIAIFSFFSPTINPEIEVVVPNSFEYDVGFGSSDETIDKSRYSGRFTLSGTYFPGQYMRVRWWPKK